MSGVKSRIDEEGSDSDNADVKSTSALEYSINLDDLQFKSNKMNFWLVVVHLCTNCSAAGETNLSEK